MSRGNDHGWRSKTADGERRDVVATRFGKRWTFRSRVKGAEDWTEHEEPMLEDLEDLLAVLQAKYTRKRIPWEHVAEIEAMVQERGGETG